MGKHIMFFTFVVVFVVLSEYRQIHSTLQFLSATAS